MNFLVTGGAGFIGSQVCEQLLHSGHAVWALDVLNAFYDPQPKRRNLRDLQSLAKPKAQARLAYQPRFKIEQGIPLFVEWFKHSAA